MNPRFFYVFERVRDRNFRKTRKKLREISNKREARYITEEVRKIFQPVITLLLYF